MGDDIINEPKPNLGLSSNGGTTYKSNNYTGDDDNTRGFVVNRPKPLHLVNNDDSIINESDDSDLASNSIPKTNSNNNSNVTEKNGNIPNIPDTDESDDLNTDEYVLAPDSSSPNDSSPDRGDFPSLDWLLIDSLHFAYSYSFSYSFSFSYSY